MRQPIIAIDGPAGSGKSTVAKLVAARLGYTYIDTGAMYRAVAVAAIESNVPVEDNDGIVKLALELEISFRQVEGEQRIFADGRDVSEAIRTPEATRLSSPVSAIPGVRLRLVELQRRMGKEGGVVMEGRDIGTYVFPDAEVKVFLTASEGERARRRQIDLERAGVSTERNAVARDIAERDERDSARSLAPLRQAEDAVLITTDAMTIEDVVNAVVEIHDRRTSRCSSG